MLNSRFSPMGAVLSDMQLMSEQLDRAFTQANTSHRSFADTFPPMNMWETEDAVLIEAELPGFSLSDVCVLVDGTTLTIEGDRKVHNVQGGVWRRRERGYGKFQRKIALPPMADSETVEATLKNGILTLKIAKREEAKARRIQVTAG